MLVGVGGSGKQTLARFAAFVSDTRCFNMELTRNYGLAEFRDDLKKLYRWTGVEGKHIAFLVMDSHIVNELFVEDINKLLNSGEQKSGPCRHGCVQRCFVLSEQHSLW